MLVGGNKMEGGLITVLYGIYMHVCVCVCVCIHVCVCMYVCTVEYG